jgi:glutamate/tyrosine decarboxylase-like PLP-dependent enzyme
LDAFASSTPNDNRQLSDPNTRIAAESGGAENVPDLDNWEQFRSLGHQIIDELANLLSTQRGRSVTRLLAPEDVAAWNEPIPYDGKGVRATYEFLATHLLPRLLGNTHPRYWGWLDGSGIPLAALADLLASALNPNVEGMDHAACFLELQVIQWWTSMLGLPPSTSGLLVSGTSTANLLAIVIARNANAGARTRQTGVKDAADLVFYASASVHLSIQRGLEIAGLGSRALHTIRTLENGAVDVDDLRDAIENDRQNGRTPACIIGTIGTTTTGAIDDIQALAQLSSKNKLWLHVDGAFGALACLVPSVAHLTRGLELADSIAFDFHKWLYLPFGVACLLVRNADAHRETFAVQASYLEGLPRPPAASGPSFSSLGIETSREFKALRVWMCMRAYGVKAFAHHIERNIRHADLLRSRISLERDLEQIAPNHLSIVCFRWRRHDGSLDHVLDDINREILLRLQTAGDYMLSGALVSNLFALRAAIVNHRANDADVDAMIATLLRLGESVAALIAEPLQPAT